MPTTWGDPNWALQVLGLNGNHILSGTLPTQLGRLRGLQYLGLDFTSLSGTLPTFLGRLGEEDRVLSTFEVAGVPTLSGTLPTQYGALSAMLRLALNGCALSGSLPSSWGRLSALEELYLKNNMLSGVIPSAWGGL